MTLISYFENTRSRVDIAGGNILIANYRHNVSFSFQ
jgi:hypothetical protein